MAKNDICCSALTLILQIEASTYVKGVIILFSYEQIGIYNYHHQ